MRPVAAGAATVPRQTQAHPAAAPASTAAQAASSSPTPPPLSVDVVRSDAGVFIYTLRDPATDTVLAVIPRAAIVPGSTLDERA